MPEYSSSQALYIMAVAAHFTPYFVVAALMVIVRLVGRKFSRAEKGLLLVFVGLLVLEYLQLSVQLRTVLPFDSPAIRRYFGVFSPILWVFAAKGLASLWGHCHGWAWKTVRIVLALALAGGLVLLNLVQLVSAGMRGTAYDTAIAAERILPVIRNDYRGPARQPEIKRSVIEYYTGRRPLISSPYGCAGWMVRGDCCGATEAPCPYLEDYLFIPQGGNYAGITEVDERIYQYVAQVAGGSGTTWLLYRRRTRVDAAPSP